MMAVLAEFERDQISERTKTALAFKKSKGQRVGTLPFGFDLAEDGETLLRNPKEQKAISLILKLSKEGFSLRKIKGNLERQGIDTKQGKTWSPKVIRSIILENTVRRAA
jgi:DNA invertase Pin-like site-specific DNA recombinase